MQCGQLVAATGSAALPCFGARVRGSVARFPARAAPTCGGRRGCLPPCVLGSAAGPLGGGWALGWPSGPNRWLGSAFVARASAVRAGGKHSDRKHSPVGAYVPTDDVRSALFSSKTGSKWTAWLANKQVRVFELEPKPHG